MSRTGYDNWLTENACGCNRNYITVLPDCDEKKDICDCQEIYLQINNIKTDVNVLSGDVENKLDISAYTPTDLSNYYTKEEVDELIPSIPSLSGYATEQWVENQGYLKTHQTLKTINGESLVGEGNIVISEGSIDAYTKQESDNRYAFKTDLNKYLSISEFNKYILNLQEQINSLMLIISSCCGSSGETTYRWITMTDENDYWCSGTTKYSKEKEQSSSDGINWVDTGNIRNGSTVLEYNSESCGYVPPISYKVQMAYINGTQDNRACDGSTVLRALNPRNWENISGVTVGNCINEIGNLCFYGFSGLTIVNLPNTITAVGGMAFNHCISLPSITIPSTVTSIGGQAFGHCYSLKTVTVPDSVERLEYATFYYCSGMTSITLSNTLKIIDNGAIESCESLQSLIIPSSVTSIGKHAFAFDTSLRSVTCLATTPPAFHDSGETGTGGNNGDIFYGCGNLTVIYVPSTSVNAYKSAWPQYASIIQAITT